MSDIPASTTASPLKRPLSTEATEGMEGTQPVKRVKQEPEDATSNTEQNPTMDDILKDDFDMANFELPDELTSADDPLLQMPQFPSNSVAPSTHGTPQMMNLELPGLPSDTASSETPTPVPTQEQNTAIPVQPALQLPTKTDSSTPAASSATATPSYTQQPIQTQPPTPQQPPPVQQTHASTSQTNGTGAAGAGVDPSPSAANTSTTSASTPVTTATKAPATTTTAAPPGTTATATSNGNNQDDASGKPSGPADPDKLSDALLSAGVDLKAEEALLNSTTLPTKPGQLQAATDAANQPIIINTPFLDPRQVATFMNKVIAAHGLKSNTEADSSLVQLMTYASEEWMKNILTNAIVLSRHRRRSIKSKRRSEMTMALRDIAMTNKSHEDNRAARKKNNGMKEKQNEVDAEETQHKATNATVAMMTGTKKKKYDWMSAGSTGSKNSVGDVSLRYREAREEPGLVVRDLLNSLEKKRIGVEKTLAKGYAKLKD